MITPASWDAALADKLRPLQPLAFWLLLALAAIIIALAIVFKNDTWFLLLLFVWLITP